MRRALAGIVLALVPVLTVGTAEAQDPQFATAVPESPAFTFLGVTPNLVSRPASVRDLAAALLSGIGPNGAVQQGFALELTPWVYVPGLSIPLVDYGSSLWKRGLANLQLSFGTVTTQGDSASTDMAMGLRTTLFDGTDAMQQATFTGPVAAGLRGCVNAVRPGMSEEEGRQAIQACGDTVMAAAWDAWEAYSEEHWNAVLLAIGLGVGARAPDSRLGSARYSGVKAWLVGGLPIGGSAQVLGQLTVADAPDLGGSPATRELTYGGRVLYGSASFHAFAEAVGVHLSDPPGGADSGVSWSGGVEFRLSDGTWATTGFGRRFQGLGEPERVVVLLGINFGLVAGSRIRGLR